MDIGRCPSVVLKECVNLFFTYQRPFCTIVDRDEIEQGLFSPMNDHRQSTLLVHAVCAMGALMSDDRHIRELANLFVASAESKLSEAPFWHSRLERAQAMLLIAVFAAGIGQISKAWMYSGKHLRSHPARVLIMHTSRYGYPHDTGPRNRRHLLLERWSRTSECALHCCGETTAHVFDIQHIR